MSESDSEYDVTSDGLSNIGSIPTKKTLMLVNNFITNTVDFMNKFASLCEKKLLAVSTQTQKLEITLNLLEAKLESVPWLDPATEQAAAPAAAAPSTAPVATAAPPAPVLEPSTALVPAEPAEAAPEAPALTSSPVKDDPRFEKYFRMLRMGVPKPMVVMKMNAESGGALDVAVLDMDPEAPAPPEDA